MSAPNTFSDPESPVAHEPKASAIIFDGQEGYVAVDGPFPAMPEGVTVEFWALGADDLPRSAAVFAAWREDAAIVLNIHIPWSDGTVYWDAGGDGYDRVHKPAEPADYTGAWAHWAFLKDVAAGEMAIYRNGALWHRDDNRTRPMSEAAHASIGSYINGAYRWGGRLAELRVWNRARSGDEIRADMNRRLSGREPGLVACWPLGQIDEDGITPELVGGRHGKVMGAKVTPDDALAAVLRDAEPEPAPAPVNGKATGAALTVATPECELTPTASVLAAVLEFNEGRKRRLVRLKLKRMAGDPFAFFRGSDHLFAEAWPGLKPPDPGPEIPLCGDLHLENFGAYRDVGGELLYDINDFDEAAVAPCSVDLVRCATSILLASELWRLTPLQAWGMVLEYLDHYRSAVSCGDALREADARAPRLARGPIWDILGKCALASQADLLDRVTRLHKDGSRRIARSKNQHRSIKAPRADAIRAAVEAYGAASGRADSFKVLDVTGRVAGIGSLGVARYTVLVAGGGSPEANRLYDLKACLPSALGPIASRPWPFAGGSEAARVVRAQRTLQASPTAGLDVLTIDGEAYRIRELIPEENRSSLGRLNKKPGKLLAAVEEAGLLTALSHLRGAAAYPDGGGADGLARWASGPALDSVLAAAARFAERTRVAHRQFRRELRSPGSLPEGMRKRYVR